MTQFWWIAGGLCVLAVAVLLFPLWRVRRAQGRWSLVGVAAAVAMVPVAIALYSHVSNWNPDVAARADEGTRLIAQLAERMRSTPDDVQGWQLLANSYIALGRYQEAAEAYRQL